jgi:hypothetical protein
MRSAGAWRRSARPRIRADRTTRRRPTAHSPIDKTTASHFDAAHLTGYPGRARRENSRDRRQFVFGDGSRKSVCGCRHSWAHPLRIRYRRALLSSPRFSRIFSPTQVNILTPPDAMTGPVQVVATNNGTVGASFTAQAQSISPSFFVFKRRPLHRRGVPQRESYRAGQFIPWIDHAGDARRNRGALRQWIWSDERARCQRVGITVGNPLAPACDSNRRRQRNGAVCWLGYARRVSVQHSAGIPDQWGSADQGHIQRPDLAGWSLNHHPKLKPLFGTPTLHPRVTGGSMSA